MIKMRKTFCAVLTLCLLLAMLPVGVLAAEDIIATSPISKADVDSDDGYDFVMGTGITPADMEVDVYEGPGLNYDIVYTLFPESVLEFYDFQTADGIEWGECEYGWVNMADVILDGDPIDPSTITAKGKNDGVAWVLYTDGTLSITEDCTISVLERSGPAPWKNYIEQIKAVRFEPQSITRIANEYFHNLVNMETVYVDSGPSSLFNGNFYGCKNFTAYATASGTSANFVVQDGLLLNQDMPDILVACPNGIKGVLELPVGITEIGEWAFLYCDQLEEVILPDGLYAVSNSAFKECTSLKTITFPASTGYLCAELFEGCTSLETIYFQGDAPENSAEASNGGIAFGTYEEGRNPADTRITATAYYPAGNETWTEEAMSSLGGNITWVPYCDHSYDSIITTAPTCTEEGVRTYTCSSCGDTYTETIPALGHSCNDGEVTQEPTCTVPGIMSYVCTVCEMEFTEELPVIDHSFVDGFCSACGQQQLGAPSILSCYSKLQDSVKVTWTTDENAEGYELWRSATPEDEDSWTRVKTINNGSTDRYTNQGLTVGVTYYYKVRAFTTDAGGNKVCSAFSNVDYMPAAVVFDGPYSNATFRIRLRWNEIGGAHGYQIWRTSFDADGWTIVKTLGDKGNELTNNQGATTAYSNTGLTAGEGYGYRIRAFRITEDGRKVFGAYSDTYTVAVMPETPVVTGTSPKANRAQLNWEDLNGAAGYQVWMAESADGEFRIVKSLAKFAETYTKTDLTSGKTYYFKVRAYTEVDGRKTFGAYSEVVAVTVQ